MANKKSMKHQYLQVFGLKLKNTSIFHPIEVVGRGSRQTDILFT